MKCSQERHTSQGVAYCHQPAAHVGRRSDHLAYITDPDGGEWLASWAPGSPNYIELHPLEDITMIKFSCTRCRETFEDEGSFVHHTCLGESDDRCEACRIESVPVEGAVRIASAGQFDAAEAHDLVVAAVKQFDLAGIPVEDLR